LEPRRADVQPFSIASTLKSALDNAERKQQHSQSQRLLPTTILTAKLAIHLSCDLAHLHLVVTARQMTDCEQLLIRGLQGLAEIENCVNGEFVRAAACSALVILAAAHA
jgi:hypothetical protein